MKADFLNSIISLLLILLIIPGIIPGIASALDEEVGDQINSTNDTLTSNLILEKFYADPVNTKPNGVVTISALVKNTGDAESEQTSIIFTTGDVEERQDIEPIEPGSEAPLISYEWTAPEKEGTVTITASLDGVDTSQQKISVLVETPHPDLIVQNILPEPANPQEGEPLNFTAEVKNQGTAPSEAALAKYYINDVPGQDISISPLSAGASTDVQFSLTPDQVKGENMEVKVVADSGNTVPESNEGNNELIKTIKVKSLLPDLMIESISLSPETPKVSESITFTATIKNNGPGTSPTSKLNYNIIGNNESSSSQLPIPALAAGETNQTTFSWTPTNEGNMEVTALIDPDTDVPESDETNNQLIVNATVIKESTSTGGGGGGSSSSGKSGSSSSGSSSGGGAGGSPEPQSNVQVKELSQTFISSGESVKFDFPQKATPVIYVSFDSKKTAGKTTTIVELLKAKSTLVSGLPSGEIYKFLNIWVGNSGFATPTNIENAVVSFKVEKSWINNNSVNESLVTLQRYNQSWEPLFTKKVGEDNNYSYFTSETPGYSFFAITANAGEANKNETQIGAKLQDTLLGSLEGVGKVALNESGNKSKAQEAREVAKTLMAIILPLFLICVGYLVVKKKI